MDVVPHRLLILVPPPAPIYELAFALAPKEGLEPKEPVFEQYNAL